MDLSAVVRAARAAALAKAVSGGVLEIRSGAKPSACEAGNSGECLASMKLGEASAKGDVVELVTSPLRGVAERKGVVGHYRVYAGSVCVLQGTAGKGGEIDIGESTVEQGQLVEVRSLSISEV